MLDRMLSSARSTSPWLLAFARAGVAVAVATFHVGAASAEPPSASSAASSAASSTAPAAASRGLAVLAVDGATDAAWSLAREIYANAALRPEGLDDARARVLAGEAPGADAPPRVRELAQLRAAVKGDDIASRQILPAIAEQLHVRGVVVVERPANANPVARVYIADTRAFDAARYAPDDGATLTWSGATESLARAFGTPPPATIFPSSPASTSAPLSNASNGSSALERQSSVALREGPKVENGPPAGKKFYESGWFWGALGAAAFIGGAVFFATRDNTPGTIHLQMQVPK
jgi:hypothetical protein